MERELLVHATSGYKYKPTPTIQIKGNYLNEFGFRIGTEVNVIFSEDKIEIVKINNRANSGQFGSKYFSSKLSKSWKKLMQNLYKVCTL